MGTLSAVRTIIYNKNQPTLWVYVTLGALGPLIPVLSSETSWSDLLVPMVVLAVIYNAGITYLAKQGDASRDWTGEARRLDDVRRATGGK